LSISWSVMMQASSCAVSDADKHRFAEGPRVADA
jgi:hypothetical protein